MIIFFTVLLVVVILSAVGVLIAYQISRYEKETTNSLSSYFDALKSFFMVQVIDRFFTAADESFDDSEESEEL